MNISFKIIFPILIVIFFTALLLLAGVYSKKISFEFSTHNYVNIQIKYQFILLLITGLSLLTTFLLNKQNFMNYFSFGQVSSIGQELKIFGIKQGDSWTKTGLSLCIVISSITAIFMYFQLKQVNPDWSTLKSGIIWIVLFALINSFGEEMIFRIGVISPLKGLISPLILCFISAILFGLPHFAGMPNGIIGATMAGVLGFVLAKSVLETNGFFWAWIIHFIQDVIIIGTLFLMSTATKN